MEDQKEKDVTLWTVVSAVIFALWLLGVAFAYWYIKLPE